ncbi:MAG TPA: hypothetical protein VIZ68_00755 [Thermoplasmata archaeon]
MSPDGRTVYVTNQLSDSVSVIDAVSNQATVSRAGATHAFDGLRGRAGHDGGRCHPRSQSTDLGRAPFPVGPIRRSRPRGAPVPG